MSRALRIVIVSVVMALGLGYIGWRYFDEPDRHTLCERSEAGGWLVQALDEQYAETWEPERCGQIAEVSKKALDWFVDMFAAEGNELRDLWKGRRIVFLHLDENWGQMGENAEISTHGPKDEPVPWKTQLRAIGHELGHLGSRPTVSAEDLQTADKWAAEKRQECLAKNPDGKGCPGLDTADHDWFDMVGYPWP